MKKLTFLSLIVTTLLLSTAFTIDETDKTTVESWTIDKPHSAITFSVRHFFTPVNGRFDDYRSDILFDPEDLANSQLDITIPVAGINTQNDQRDNHLKSEDFFNTAEWSNIRFVSSTIERTGDNRFVARGKFTIRDVTRSFDLQFEHLGTMEHPMMDNTKVAGFTASAQLNRTDFGVGVGDWAATMVVGDQVDIQINLELTASD